MTKELDRKLDEAALTASHLSAGMIGYTLYGEGSKKGIAYAGPEGPNTALLDIWGAGCLELHQELSQYAQPICQLLSSLGELQDFPGVFHYEVTEEFGEWFAEMIVENDGGAPMGRCCKEKIALLTAEFFSQLPGAVERAKVFNVLEPLGWAKTAALSEALFPPAPAVASPTSLWAVETVEPYFHAGDEVFYKNGAHVRMAKVDKVYVTHRISEGGSGVVRNATVHYELAGVGSVSPESVFQTAEEAFAAQ